MTQADLLVGDGSVNAIDSQQGAQERRHPDRVLQVDPQSAGPRNVAQAFQKRTVTYGLVQSLQTNHPHWLLLAGGECGRLDQ